MEEKYNQEEFRKVVEPAIEWMNKNTHPHHTIIITHTSAELLEGSMAHHTKKFLQVSDSSKNNIGQLPSGTGREGSSSITPLVSKRIWFDSIMTYQIYQKLIGANQGVPYDELSRQTRFQAGRSSPTRRYRRHYCNSDHQVLGLRRTLSPTNFYMYE